jgi:hypothetical protein
MRQIAGRSLSTSVNGRPMSLARALMPSTLYATSFITAMRPSRVIAITPLRRLQTRSR